MMRTAEDLLKELAALDESHRIEAKRAQQIDRSIIETICAFANEPGLGGGYLLLGVSRDSQDLFASAYRIDGIDQPDKLQSDLASQCATMLNRPIRPRVAVEEVDGKRVMVVFVAEAAPTDKPVFIQNLGLPRGAFRRVGSTDQEGTEDDLVALYAGHQVDTFDASLLADAEMGDIDPAAVNDYRQQRLAINSDAEELRWSDEELMLALGCAKRDNRQMKPTVAGLLLFGSTMALRRCFPMMRIDYIRVPGRQWVENPDHRFDTLEIRAPLLTAIRRATNAVRDELMQSFSLPEGAIAREDEPSLPLRVIREAIVNAVMHRSYRIHGAIQIIRYTNRLEIRNPGHSIKAEEQLGEPGSETRNPRLAAVLHEINVAETKGSGIRAMRQLMVAQNLLPPTFESSRRPDQFVATFLFHHFLGPDDLSWLKQLTSEPLSDEESRVLVFVRELGAVNNAAYRNINRTDTLDASVHLRRLRDLGLLEMKGSGSQTYYVAGAGLLSLNSDSGTKVGQNLPDSRHFEQNPHHPLGESSPPGRESSPPARESSPPFVSAHQLFDQVPQDLKTRLATLGEKPRREILRMLVLDLCRWNPMSSRELADLLGGRNHKVLVRDLLSPLVNEGVLQYTIPEMENHPDQRYVTQ